MKKIVKMMKIEIFKNWRYNIFWLLCWLLSLWSYFYIICYIDYKHADLINVLLTFGWFLMIIIPPLLPLIKKITKNGIEFKDGVRIEIDIKDLEEQIAHAKLNGDKSIIVTK